MTSADRDPEVAVLLRAGRPADTEPLAPRDLRAQAMLGGAFVLAAVALGLLLDAEREWPALHAVLLTLLFAGALRLRFEVGAGFTVAVQLAFVPMLLLLPTPWVPMLVLAGFLVERLPDLARSHLHPSRLLLLPAGAWFAIGPAAVLVIGDAQTPEWSDWPVYLAALAAQLAVDGLAGQLGEWLGRGIPPSLGLRAVGVVPLIDALLAPLGLLAAFASESFEFAYLLLVPPAGMLLVYGRERSRRLAAAIELVETEREALRSREALVAGASHEILTPLAIVSGLANRLTASDLDAERRERAVASLRREVLQLRHLSRQFVDYTRLKAGQPLIVRPRRTPVAEVLEEVAGTFGARTDVRVDLDGARPHAHVDPDRLQQMLMILVSNAVKHAPGSPIGLSLRAVDRTVEIAVSDAGRGIPGELRDAIFEDLARGSATVEGAGIGLYLCRHLARTQGGDVRVRDDGPGATFVLALPAA